VGGGVGGGGRGWGGAAPPPPPHPPTPQTPIPNPHFLIDEYAYILLNIYIKLISNNIFINIIYFID